MTVLHASDRFTSRGKAATDPSVPIPAGAIQQSAQVASKEGVEYRLASVLVAAAVLANNNRKEVARKLCSEVLKSNMAPWMRLPPNLGHLVEQVSEQVDLSGDLGE